MLELGLNVVISFMFTSEDEAVMVRGPFKNFKTPNEVMRWARMRIKTQAVWA